MGEMSLGTQVAWLFILAIPIACIAWTVTHEEVFKELHDYCVKRSKNSRKLLQRKFFYALSCEYCFSHYVTIFFLLLTKYHLLLPDWRGYLIGGFALVWVANVYMSIHVLIRLGIKDERAGAEIKEKELEKVKQDDFDPNL